MAAEQRILICGDRNWTDSKAVSFVIKAMMPPYPKNPSFDLVIIEGDARGADRIAGEIAETFGLRVLKYPANWAKYGKAAGPIRNQQMLDEGKPDSVYAFHDDLENSKGTRDMMQRALNAQIPVYHVLHDAKGLIVRDADKPEQILVQVSWLKSYNKEGIKTV